LSEGGGGFKESYFADLASIEEGYFWFRARNRLILWALGKYAAGFRSFLEIGCGTGYVLSGIARAYPGAELHGAEVFSAGLAFAAARQPAVDFMQMDAGNIPFVEEFDAIGAFDVLEHIEDDGRVLSQIYEALKPKGVLFLTVPQHAWMWSAVDDRACHVRRYSAGEIHEKVRTAGFRMLRSTSFVSSLLPAMIASRLLRKQFHAADDDGMSEVRIHRGLDLFFEKVLGVEAAMIRCGINFPFGGSRLVVARKIG
jgi:SAM-dependent methyltransferase